ncbi:hypothetical protein [Cryptosporangium japonicum]|uniref:hypothetical protein n=1 Tax=Cryptosporangium japonicum TaxID=80872 RepID=UPI0031D2CC88
MAVEREASGEARGGDQEVPVRRGLPAEVIAAMRPASALGRPSGERTGLPFRAGDPVPTREPAADSTSAEHPAPAAAGTATIDPEATGSAADEDLADEADDGVDEFLEELQLWLEDEPAPSEPVDEWIRAKPLRIAVINADSIAFEAPDGRTLGPIPLPEGLADQVELGWRLRLTAARTGDTWHLRPND